ncbi:MAG: substrate-binding domain-containing protein [Candidatus Eremiobacteraeota bacterium]|nr:substrate-binding domain-containing protein [Candidatus Eremiobacteraeota bacterium]
MRIGFGRALQSALALVVLASAGVGSLASAGTANRVTVMPRAPVHGSRVPEHRVKRNAGAGPIYYAGGGTVPSIAFVGTTQAAAGQSNPAVVPGPGTSGSIFDYFVLTYSPNRGADTISYCEGSAGFGKAVMDGANENDQVSQPTPLPANANLTCASPVGQKQVLQTNGFSAVGQDFGDFAGIDQLSANDFNTWVNNAQSSGHSISGRGLPVQVPYIIASIALFYDNSDPAVESQQLKLTSTQLCKIADGEITNWNQLNSNFASKTLSFAVRSDSAGASFGLSNHLNAVCKGAGETYGVSNNYDEYIPGNPSIGALPNPLPQGATTQFFLSASGNAGVVSTVESHDGSIGYVEAASALAGVNGSNLNFALVNGKNPVTNLPASAGLVKASALLKSSAFGSDVANARAPIVTLSPTDNCLLLENPMTYANPAKGYPIILVVSLIFSQAGNGTDAADLQALAYMVSQKRPEAVGPGKITTIDVYGRSQIGQTGYSTLNQGTFGKIVKSTATSCIGQ